MYKDKNGYGQLTYKMRTMQAHTFYYEQAYGAVPTGKQLDHLCRIRCCVNPNHVEPVTSQENTRRGNKVTLSPRLVSIAKRLLNEGLVGQRELSRDWGICTQSIHAMAKGVTWRDIPAARISHHELERKMLEGK